jgi:polyphosphate kinase
MGTGNYNDATAHFYTDMGLFTANSDMGIDATNIFNMLSGYSKPPYFHQLHISPQGIRDFINDRLDQAIAVAKQDKPALVRMKMNSLSDQQIIAHLYEASRAGVKIELIVRGICCLKVGIEGVSDNIAVHSIVGRFLEHSRIFIFDLDHEVSTYLASADMMTRNLNRRVELLFPINAIPTKNKVNQIFDTMWNDNVKSRILQSDDSYQRIDRRGIAKMSSQDVFIKNAERQMMAAKRNESPTTPENFKPMLSPKNQPNLLSDEGSDE